MTTLNIFVPSLQHMALVKVAIALCNYPEIRALIDEENFQWRTGCRTYNITQELMKDILDTAAKILSAFVHPNLPQKKILGVVRSLNKEIEKWIKDHSAFLHHEIDQQNNFCWRSEGTIDKQKTAKLILQNRNIDIECRFYLACFYCMEEEVQSIWNQMSEMEKMETEECARFRILQSWINWVKNGMESCEETYSSWFSLSLHCTPAIQNLLKKLTPEEGRWHLEKVSESFGITYNALLFYLPLLKEDEKTQIFRKNPLQTLLCCLDWPQQSTFMEMANRFWNLLTPDEFCSLLKYILHLKIIPGCEDYNYVALFRYLWQRSSPHYKEYVKKHSMFSLMRIVLSHDHPQQLIVVGEFDPNLNEIAILCVKKNRFQICQK